MRRKNLHREGRNYALARVRTAGPTARKPQATPPARFRQPGPSWFDGKSTTNVLPPADCRCDQDGEVGWSAVRQWRDAPLVRAAGAADATDRAAVLEFVNLRHKRQLLLPSARHWSEFATRSRPAGRLSGLPLFLTVRRELQGVGNAGATSLEDAPEPVFAVADRSRKAVCALKSGVAPQLFLGRKG